MTEKPRTRLRTLRDYMVEQSEGLNEIRGHLEQMFGRNKIVIPAALEETLSSIAGEQGMRASKQVLVEKGEERGREEWSFIAPSQEAERLMSSLSQTYLNEVRETAALLPIRDDGQPNSKFLVDCAIKTRMLRFNASPQRPLALDLHDGGVIRLIYNKGLENWRRRYSLEYYLSINLAAGEYLYQLSSCDLPSVDFKVLFPPVLLFTLHSHERQRRMKKQ